MRTLFLTLLIASSLTTKSQQVLSLATIEDLQNLGSTLESVKDTIPCYLVLLDSTHNYDYYNKSGVIRWRNVMGYDPTLIPSGGKAVQGNLFSPTTIAMDGFIVIEKLVPTNEYLSTVAMLGKDKKPIDKKYIKAWPFNIPVNGF